MNRTVATIGALLLALTLGGFARAEEHRSERPARDERSAEQRAEAMTERMNSMLELDQAQRSRVAEINLRYAREMQSLRELDKEERKTQMMELRNRKHGELSGVLSEQQMSKLQEKMRERHEQRSHKGDGRGKGKSKGERN